MLNPRETVAKWVDRIRRELARFLDFDDIPNRAVLVSNLDWTADMPVLDFLRDIGKHFPVNQMLARESVRARLEAGGISYTEFSYQILQAMDFLELYRRQDCTLQIGGSDQWGNLVAGRRPDPPGRRRLGPRPGHPADHQAGRHQVRQDRGRRHLDQPRPDEPVRVLPVLAQRGGLRGARPAQGVHVPVPRGDRGPGAPDGRAPPARAGQRALAEDLTTLVHGADATARVIAASRALFGQGDLHDVDQATLADAASEVPHTEVFLRDPDEALPPVTDLMALTGIVASKSAARRAIAEGGAYLNNTKVTEPDAVPSRADLLHGRYLILRRGKRTVGAVDVQLA